MTFFELDSRQNGRNRPDGGFALCALVGIIAILGITVLVFNCMARSELKDSVSCVEKVREQMAARAGINYGIWVLREQGDMAPAGMELEVGDLRVDVEIETEEKNALMHRIKSACSRVEAEAVVKASPRAVELFYLRTD